MNRNDTGNGLDGVMAKAVGRAAVGLGLSSADLGNALGMAESLASDLMAGRPTHLAAACPDVAERALLLVGIARDLDAICGGDGGSIRSWMRSDNHALRGCPAALVQGLPGLTAVSDYLQQQTGAAGGT